MNDPDGLIDKYYVHRKSDEVGKHVNCFFFVLDIHHDVHARAALTAYALSCREEYPQLSDDLMTKLYEIEQGLNENQRTFEFEIGAGD